MDRLSNYSLSCRRDGGDLTPLFKKMENPRPSLLKKRKPVALTASEKQDDVENDIYKEKIKLFVSRDNNLSRNM